MRIGLTKIRRDGFIALEAGAETGQVVTKPFRVEGDRLEVNIDALKGRLQVEILDDKGNPFPSYSLEDSRLQTGVDSVRAQPAWKNRANLAPLRGTVGRGVGLRTTSELRLDSHCAVRTKPLARRTLGVVV